MVSIFVIPDLYQELLGHVGPDCEHEGGSTNLSEKVEGGYLQRMGELSNKKK